MAHQAVQDRFAALELMRPRILAGHGPACIVGEAFDERRPLRLAAVREDLLHQFLVGCCAHVATSPLADRSPIIARGTPFFQSIVDMIYIHPMNLNSLDLNLLVALDALLREANVSRAAMRIGLSQPAASHALQRLRDLLGDPLLVRTGARMELTPRAQALRGPLAQALDQVRGLFDARRIRRRPQRTAVPADDAGSRGRTADAAADGEGRAGWRRTSGSTSCRGGGRRSSTPSSRAPSTS